MAFRPDPARASALPASQETHPAEPAPTAAEATPSAPAEDAWRVVQAIWDVGRWLVCFRSDGLVEAWAPPGVGLAESPHDMSARQWRRATWSTFGRFNAELAPDGQVVPIQGLKIVADRVPESQHDWLIGEARAQAAALESAARLVAANPGPNAEAEVTELLDDAFAITTDIELMRSSMLPEGQAEDDELRAEISALFTLVSSEASTAANQELLVHELKRLEPKLRQLLRHHAYITRSKSWRITKPLRGLREALKVVRKPRQRPGHGAAA